MSQMPHTPQEPDANCLYAHRNLISTRARCSLKQVSYEFDVHKKQIITAAQINQMFTGARCSQQPIAHMNVLTDAIYHRSQVLTGTRCSQQPIAHMNVLTDAIYHRSQVLTGTRCSQEPNSLARCSQEPDSHRDQMLLHKSDAHRSQILSEAIYYRHLMLTGTRCLEEPNTL